MFVNLIRLLILFEYKNIGHSFIYIVLIIQIERKKNLVKSLAINIVYLQLNLSLQNLINVNKIKIIIIIIIILLFLLFLL